MSNVVRRWTVRTGTLILVLVLASGLLSSQSAQAAVSPSNASFVTSSTPTISGNAVLGATLNAKQGAWSPRPTVTWQWNRDGKVIPKATGSAYTVTLADVGARISVTMNATHSGIAKVVKTSAGKLVPGSLFALAPNPTIAGAATIGSVLNAKQGNWSPKPSASFRWNRNGVPIPGATGTSYAVTSADAGTQISLTMTATKSGYITQVKTSAPLMVPSLVFVNSPAPTITGTATVGSALHAKQGLWTPTPTVKYSWNRNGVPILGASTSSYTVTSADLGAVLTVTMTATRSGYRTDVKTSMGRPVPNAAFVSAPAPTIVGAVVVGATLHAKQGSWTPKPTATWQWNRDGRAIPGEVASTFILTAADAGALITVTMSAARSGYATLAKTSNSLKVPELAFAASPAPTISGSAKVGSTLHAKQGVWIPTPTATYEWKRNGVPIQGAKLSSYVLTAADAGALISVSMTGMKKGYSSVSKSSAEVRVGGAVPPTEVAGVISADTTWGGVPGTVYQATSFVSVPDGVTLTITEGVVLKDLNIDVTGKLVVKGSKKYPVIFTSLSDDVAGGDTNGDGDASSPSEESSSTHIGICSAGDVSLSFAEIRYSAASISACTDHYRVEDGRAKVSIRDSKIQGQIQLDRYVVAAPIIERSSIMSNWGPTLSVGGFDCYSGTCVDVSGISLSGPNANVIGSSDGLAVVRYSNATVPHGTNLSVPAGSSKVVLDLDGLSIFGSMYASGNVMQGSARVESGGLLQLQAGTIWKNPSIDIQGTMRVNGTSKSPVILTDGADDTAGGDSNGEGESYPHFPEYGPVKPFLSLCGAGDLSVAFAEIRHATGSISTCGTYGSPYSDGSAKLRVTDSNLDGGVRLGHNVVAAPVLERNVIKDRMDGPLSVFGAGCDADYCSDVSRILLSGPGANKIESLIGPTHILYFNVGIPVGQKLSVPDASSSFELSFSSFHVLGTVELAGSVVNGGVYVPAGGELIVQGGSVWKNPSLKVEGKLSVSGGSSSPVIFTSSEDDTVGGDSNGDGDATTPEIPQSGPIDYYIEVCGAADVSISYAETRYAGGAVTTCGGYWSPYSDGSARLSITDSTLEGGVDLGHNVVGAPILVRNSIASLRSFPLAVAGSGCDEVNCSDVSGIVLSGPDANTVLNRSGTTTIYYWDVGIPAGKEISMPPAGSRVNIDVSLELRGSMHTSGNILHGAVTVAAGARLEVGAGTVWKDPRIAVLGTLNVDGSSDAPVVFTSRFDDSVAGDTNDDGNETQPSPTGDWPWIEIGNQVTDTTIDFAVFKYASTALRVGELSTPTVSSSKFLENVAAFEVAGAASFDPSIGYFYGYIPCAPPYNSTVNVTNSWFDSSPHPSDTFDFQSAVISYIPGSDDGFDGMYSAMSQQLDFRASTGMNTRPWAMYTCTPSGSGAEVGFPVTPVLVVPALNDPLPNVRV